MKKQVALLFLLGAMCSFAATRTYVGTDGVWGKSENWNPAGVPVGGDIANFTAACTITGDVELPSGNVTIQQVGELTISGRMYGAGGFIHKNGSSAGTLKITNAGNTFQGAVTNTSGILQVPEMGRIGEASYLGAPPAENARIYNNGTFKLSGKGTETAVTDRSYHGGSSSELNISGTHDMTGELSGVRTWMRGSGTLILRSYCSNLTTFSRTDSGSVYMMCPTNSFTGDVSFGCGHLYAVTISNKNENCSIGRGTSMSFGQAGYYTPGFFYYLGMEDAETDRSITVNSARDSTYARYDGLTLTTATNGVKVVYRGTVTHNADAGCPFLMFAGAGDGEIVQGLPGSFNVRKSGTGTWTLSGANTATGKMEVNAGRLNIDGSWTADSAGIQVARGATLGGTGVVHSATTLATGGILAPGSTTDFGTLSFQGPLSLSMGAKILYRADAHTNDIVHVAGTPQLGGTLEVVVSSPSGSELPAGRYTLMTWQNRPAGAFNLSGVDGVLLAEEHALVLTIGATSLTWSGDGTANAWNGTAANWNTGTSVFRDGLAVFFDDTGSDTPDVTVEAGGVAPLSVTVGAETRNYSFVGGPFLGDMSFQKTGGSTLTLANDCFFHGMISVLGGRTVLSGTVNGPSLNFAEDAALIQTPTSRISGEDIRLTLQHGGHQLLGTNDFTGRVTFDASAKSGMDSLYFYVPHAKSLGNASILRLITKACSSDRYPYISFSNNTEMAKSMTLVVARHESDTGRYVAFAQKTSTTVKWPGNIEVEDGVGVAPNFHAQTATGSSFEFGTTGETEIRGFVNYSLRGANTVRFRGRIVNGTSLSPNDGTHVYLYMPSNELTSVNASYGEIICCTNDAFATPPILLLGKNSEQWGASHWSRVDLNGTTQTFSQVKENYVGKGGFRYITSDQPAQLTVDGTVDASFGSVSPYGNGRIMGAVAIVKAGTSTWTLAATNTFSGDVTVRGGTLKADSPFALGDSTNKTVFVMGGRLQLAKGDVLAEPMALQIAAEDGSAGVVQLDADQVVGTLQTGDRPRTAGTYGSPSSTAATKLACFTGSGILTVRHGNSGTLMLFR